MSAVLSVYLVWSKSPDWVSALSAGKHSFIHGPVPTTSEGQVCFAIWQQIAVLQVQFFT